MVECATIRKFRIVQNKGSRQVSREVNHYNLQAIIAVCSKVNNERAVQFRKWAGQIVQTGCLYQTLTSICRSLKNAQRFFPKTNNKKIKALSRKTEITPLIYKALPRSKTPRQLSLSQIIPKYLSAYSIPSSSSGFVTNDAVFFSSSDASPITILFGTAMSIGKSFILSPIA